MPPQASREPMNMPHRISARPEKQKPELSPLNFCCVRAPDCLHRDFQRVANAEAVMYHVPTNTAFEIVYDPDQAMLGGQTVFGFAARISDVYTDGQPPEDTEALAAIGRDAITAFLNEAATLFEYEQL
jgi:hypothetical protein